MRGFVRCDKCKERVSDVFPFNNEKLCIKCYSNVIIETVKNSEIKEQKKEKKNDTEKNKSDV